MRYVYCHPLFDERKCAHRFSYQLSKAFEKNDLQLERFDYQGTGEANGEFCDVTIGSLRNDLETIVDSDCVCLIGTRFGATVAFDFCCQIESAVKRIVLIEPIVNGQNYVKYLFRKQHLKDIMTGNSNEISSEYNFRNIGGYKTSNKFLEHIKQIYLPEMIGQTKVDNIYIIQVSAFSKINTEYAFFANDLKNSGIKVSVEILNLPVFWERVPDTDYSVLTNKIVEWCVD